MKILNILIISAIILFGVTFALLNGHSVDIKYYLGETNMPLSLLLAIALVLGIFVGLGVNLISIIKLKFENSGLNKKIKQNQEEISKLRLLNIDGKD